MTRHSMTGFGRGEATVDGVPLVAEVRTVNARHLEVRARLPREVASLEPKVKALCGEYFARGNVDVSVRLPRDREGSGAAVEVDREAARRYFEEARALGETLGIDGSLTLSALLSLPGVARLREAEPSTDALSEAVLAAVRDACVGAAEMRASEGGALAGDLEARIAKVESGAAEVEARAGEVQRALREKLEKRLANLAPDIEVDAHRLEQEVVLYADRLDVTEEIVRLRSHTAQFRETLAIAGPVGRKLEFLLQEFGREVNTIGSKASDAPIARLVVELKTELEKLREQVLNIE